MHTVAIDDTGRWEVVHNGRAITTSRGVRIGASLTTLSDLRDAIHRAKRRTDDASLGAMVRDGLVQIVRVTYDAQSRATVTPVTDYVGAAAAVAYLNTMRTED